MDKLISVSTLLIIVIASIFGAGSEVFANKINLTSDSGIDQIGHLDLSTSNAVGVSGDYVYLVSTSNDILWSISVSDPFSPTLVGQCNLSIGYGYDWGTDIKVSNGIAYVAAYGHGVRAVDVSDPSLPQEISSFANYGYDLDINESIVYIADRSYGFRAFDVSNPDFPSELFSYDISYEAMGVAISNNLAFVTFGYGGLHVIDISNPNNPQKIGGYENYPFFATDISVSGNFAYIFDQGSATLRIFDVTDPENPTYVTNFGDWDSNNHRVDSSGSIVSIAAKNHGLTIIDASYPNSPRDIGLFTSPESTNNLNMKGNYIYVAASDGLYILEANSITALDVRYVDQIYVQEQMECIPNSGCYWNHCGPSSMAMLLSYKGIETRDVTFNKQATLDLVCEVKNGCSGATIPNKMISALRNRGVNAFIDWQPDMEDIKESIDNGHPVILSIRNASHILVVVGYDNSSIIVNDPYGSFSWWDYEYPQRINLPYDGSPKFLGKEVIYKYDNEIHGYYAIFVKGSVTPSSPSTVNIDDSGGVLNDNGIIVDFPSTQSSLSSTAASNSVITITNTILQGTDKEILDYEAVVTVFDLEAVDVNQDLVSNYPVPFDLSIKVDNRIIEQWYLVGGFSSPASNVDNRFASYVLVAWDPSLSNWIEISSEYNTETQTIISQNESFTEYALVIEERQKIFLPLMIR